jgi:CubicO group peptidase (beta-lactamase class C family)
MKHKMIFVKIQLIYIVLTLIMGLLAVRPVQAQPGMDESAPDKTYQKVGDYLEQQLKALNVPGAALAILEGDRIVYEKGFGVSAPGATAPTPQTSFVICSLTKSFTAMAIMQQVEAGKINLDAPVQSYLPWFKVADPEASARMTVRHLLNQTSGFSQPAGMIPLTNFDAKPGATERQARELATYQHTRPVGLAFDYSNVNYNLLGLIVEAVSGERYADYVQQHIFIPLEMKHSFTSKEIARENGMSTGYQSWFGVPIAAPNLVMPMGSLPSGELISSTEDLAHYLMAQLNEGRYKGVQVLSAAGIDEMHRPAADTNTTGVDLGKYGMGWFIQQTPQGRRYWHNGTGPDYFAYMALLPDQKRGLVLLVNTNQMVLNFALSEVGGGAADLLAGAPPKDVPWAAVPWSMRAFLLIPLFQMIGVLVTLRSLSGWRREDKRRPGAFRKWVFHIVLPILLDLLLVIPALILLSNTLCPFILLFLPDLAWLLLVCAAFALVWGSLRTWLVLAALK